MGSHIFGFFGIRQFYVLRHIGLKISIYYFLGGGRRSFIDPICFSYLHGFAHVSKPGYQRDPERDT